MQTREFKLSSIYYPFRARETENFLLEGLNLVQLNRPRVLYMDLWTVKWLAGLDDAAILSYEGDLND